MHLFLFHTHKLCKRNAKVKSMVISQVSLCDIDSEIGEQVSDELGAKYGRKNVLFCQCDVTDYPQYEGNYVYIFTTF